MRPTTKRTSVEILQARVLSRCVTYFISSVLVSTLASTSQLDTIFSEVLQNCKIQNTSRMNLKLLF